MRNNTLTTEYLTKKVLMVIIAVVLVAAILIPIIDSVTKTTIDIEQINEDSSGIDLALYDLTAEHSNRSVTVTLSGDNLTFTGDYVKTLPVSDMVVCICDSNTLFVKGGSLIYFDGVENHTVTEMVLTIIGNTVNSQTAEWVYFPTTNGIYSSYNDGYDYALSDAVAVGTFAGVTVISTDNDVDKSNLDGIYAHLDESVIGVNGVTYDGVEA